MALEVEGLTLTRGKRIVLKDVHFRAMPGEIVTVLGPNGIGKTTLFKALLGFLPPRAGRMRWNGEDLLRLPRRALARLIGYVPQLSAPVFPFTALGGRLED
ncbi:MAG: ABC transporter ATP-binding protein [Hydrogenibacillus schlegelii]|nr:ABC transporter ATP-binding protein [Hydrogenibacillus schlegelii]